MKHKLYTCLLVLFCYFSGNAATGFLEGTIYWEKNQNCVQDLATETPQKNWIICFRNSIQNYYTTTDGNGYYSLELPLGWYEIQLIPPSIYWKSNCYDLAISNVLLLQNENQRVVANYGVNPIVDCALLVVDMSTPSLERCSHNEYQIYYRNEGTDTAKNAYVIANFDYATKILSSSLPYTYIPYNTLKIQLGDIPPAGSSTIYVDTYLACGDSTTIGQTHCATARIYPDTICVSSFQVPLIDIQAVCSGDSITFTIRNNSDIGMNSARLARIFEDQVIIVSAAYQLQGREQIRFTIPIQPGHNYTATAEPDEAYSNSLLYTNYNDGSIISSIQGCGNISVGEGGGLINADFPPQGFQPVTDGTVFEFDDTRPQVVTTCMTTATTMQSASYKKTGYPKGITQEHLIPISTQLSYQIVFQNNLLERVTTAEIEDILDPNLDYSTLQMGVSNYAYTYSLQDNKLIIKFTTTIPSVIFQPDSGTVYVKFYIKPKKDLLARTIINNQAKITQNQYYVFYTNTTTHTIQQNTTLPITPIQPYSNEIKVYPNPANNYLYLDIAENNITQDTKLKIYDITGKIVKETPLLFLQNKIQISNLDIGLYFYTISNKGDNLLHTGKIQIQR